MYIDRLKLLFDSVMSKFRKTETAENDHDQEIEDFAEQIMEYGRMIHNDTPHQRLFVNVTEVARRFREDRQRVLEALELLRTQGRADRTARSEDWKLNIPLAEQDKAG